MRRSEAWARSQIGQQAIVKVATTNVVAKMGSGAPMRQKFRKKLRRENLFRVGETEIGGEEEI
jgi:hypothetical protein